MLEDPLQGSPLEIVLLASPSLAHFFRQHPTTDFNPLIHVLEHLCSSPSITVVVVLPNQISVTYWRVRPRTPLLTILRRISRPSASFLERRSHAAGAHAADGKSSQWARVSRALLFPSLTKPHGAHEAVASDSWTASVRRLRRQVPKAHAAAMSTDGWQHSRNRSRQPKSGSEDEGDALAIAIIRGSPRRVRDHPDAGAVGWENTDRSHNVRKQREVRRAWLRWIRRGGRYRDSKADPGGRSSRRQ